MAYEALIQFIESIVKANGNEEITGTNMQAVLEQIVAVVGAPQFRGVASPATDPGIPVGPASYISATAGEYVNFASIEVVQGELAILRWTGATWVKETIQSYVSDIFVRDYRGVPFVQSLIKVKGTQETEVTILQKANGVIIPGIVSWAGTGLEFNMSYVVYICNNIPFTIVSTSFVLDPADPDLDRIDVVAVNDQGAVEILKGTPAESPIKPQVDYHQIELTYIIVKAGALTPEINEVVVWNENTESVGTADLIIADFDNLNFPKVGLKAVNASSVQRKGSLKFTMPVSYKADIFKNISLYLRLKMNLPTGGKLYAQFFNGANAISDQQPFIIEQTLVNEYQFIAIGLDMFRFSSLDFNAIKLQYIGANFSGFYLDYLRLEGGIGTPTTNDYLGWYFDAMTEGGVVRTFIRSGDNAFFQPKLGSRIKMSRSSHITNGNVLEIDFDETGLVGASAYIYVAYASDINGTGFTLVNDPALAYTAVLATDTEIPIPAVEDFAGLWYNRKGINGVTPHIGANLHWWIGETDTGIVAEGQDGNNGNTPYIGENLHWWIAGVDTGILAQGTNGVGVPAGGTTGQKLKKLSGVDYATEWGDDTDLFIPANQSVNLTGSGLKTRKAANESQVFGDVCYINAGGKAQKALGSGLATSFASLFCLGTVAANALGVYLKNGYVRNDAWNWTPRIPIYLAAAGGLTQDPPAVLDGVVQVLAIPISATEIDWDPSLSQVVYK